MAPLGSGLGTVSAAGTSSIPVCASPCASSASASTAPSGGLTVTASDPVSYAGALDEYTATPPVGFTATGFTWWWGNGAVSSTTSGTASYGYPGPGNYLVYVQATNASGSIYDNHQSLLRHNVLPSADSDVDGNLPDLSGSIVANTTTNVNATGTIAPGGVVVVENWVVLEPSNPQWTDGVPSYTLASPGSQYATLSASVLNATGINGVTVSLSTTAPNGSYALNFSLPLSGPLNGVVTTVWANYTFTIFVESGALVPAETTATSPHPGTLVEYTADEFYDFDPQLEYDTSDVSLLQNVYQSLLFHNVSQDGSSPQDFVPNLATCVPGSELCQQMYGSSLETNQGNYTVVINPNATFYDPLTGGHWPVEPNDVAFGLARDCLSADIGYPGYTYPGWDLCQALLPGPTAPTNASNISWDFGEHYPYNNTPGNILSAILVNDSTYCPASSPMRDGVHGNGCVTFVTANSGSQWPEFLDDLGMVTGVSIGSCSVLTSRGQGLPAWSSSTDSCYGAPPGSPGNPNPVPAPTDWDPFIQNISALGVGGSWFDLPVGSGPYYIASISPAHPSTTNITEIVLKANPYWGGTSCVGGRLAGCLPAGDLGGGTPSYVSTVDLVNNGTGNTSAGEAALADGTADLADVSDFAELASSVSSGSDRAVPVPTGTVYALGVNFDYNQSQASGLLGQASTLPPSLLSDLNFRQFLINSYPWSEAQQEACTEDSILLCEQFGGILPAYLGGYDPANLSWPSGNPSASRSVVGSAGWWWAQADADANVTAACSASSPCVFPVPYLPGVPEWNTSVALWAQNVESISGGVVQPIPVSTGPNIYQGTVSPPGQSPYVLQYDGWLPDVYDPSTYMTPYVTEGADYGYYNNQSELEQPEYSGSCGGEAQSPVVSQACQGSAYRDLETLVAEAGACAQPACSVSHRELLYNEADHLVVSLGLLLPLFQGGEVISIANWIDPSSIVNDPYSATTTVLGVPLWDIRYVQVVPPVYPLQVTAPGGFSQTAGSSSPASHEPRRVASAPVVESGETLLILVGVAGGTGIYHFDWTGLPTGCSTADSGAITCEPSTSGMFYLQVNVTDSAGDRGQSPVVVVDVNPGPAISAFQATPDEIALGASTTFSVAASGGIGALTYEYIGLPAGCSGADASVLVCTPSVKGAFSVVAEIHDSIGVVAVATTTLNVTTAVVPPSSGSSGPSSTAELEFLGLGTAIGAAAATAAFLVAGRRKARGKPPAEPPPESD